MRDGELPATLALGAAHRTPALPFAAPLLPLQATATCHVRSSTTGCSLHGTACSNRPRRATAARSPATPNGAAAASLATFADSPRGGAHGLGKRAGRDHLHDLPLPVGVETAAAVVAFEPTPEVLAAARHSTEALEATRAAQSRGRLQ